MSKPVKWWCWAGDHWTTAPVKLVYQSGSYSENATAIRKDRGMPLTWTHCQCPDCASRLFPVK